MEDGTELPISEELRNTVKKLRSLVETELGVGMYVVGKTDHNEPLQIFLTLYSTVT